MPHLNEYPYEWLQPGARSSPERTIPGWPLVNGDPRPAGLPDAERQPLPADSPGGRWTGPATSLSVAGRTHQLRGAGWPSPPVVVPDATPLRMQWGKGCGVDSGSAPGDV